MPEDRIGELAGHEREEEGLVGDEGHGVVEEFEGPEALACGLEAVGGDCGGGREGGAEEGGADAGAGWVGAVGGGEGEADREGDEGRFGCGADCVFEVVAIDGYDEEWD